MIGESTGVAEGGKPVLLGTIVVLVLVGLGAAISIGLKLRTAEADQRKLESIHIGMSESEVVALLGEPKQQTGPPLSESSHGPCQTAAVREALYYREMRQSLHVYYDSAGNVICTSWSHTLILDPINI